MSPRETQREKEREKERERREGGRETEGRGERDRQTDRERDGYSSSCYLCMHVCKMKNETREIISADFSCSLLKLSVIAISKQSISLTILTNNKRTSDETKQI